MNAIQNAPREKSPSAISGCRNTALHKRRVEEIAESWERQLLAHLARSEKSIAEGDDGIGLRRESGSYLWLRAARRHITDLGMITK